MRKLASLPMYDLPEIVHVHDVWWKVIGDSMRQEGLEAPAQLTRDISDRMTHWAHVDTLLSQTCGWPATILGDRIQIIAAPEYAVDGCRGSTYSSWIVARADSGPGSLEDAQGTVVCFNSNDSLSGYHLMRRAVAPIADGAQFFSRACVSGAHRNSLEMIQNKQADIAAIDCVTWALLATHAPGAIAELKIIGQTPSANSLPYVTSAAHADLAGLLMSSLQKAVQDARSTLPCSALFIEGFVNVSAADYATLPDLSLSVRSCTTLPFSAGADA